MSLIEFHYLGVLNPAVAQQNQQVIHAPIDKQFYLKQTSLQLEILVT